MVDKSCTPVLFTAPRVGVSVCSEHSSSTFSFFDFHQMSILQDDDLKKTSRNGHDDIQL